MPVHLTGRMADMKSIVSIAKKYKLKVIEDAAQSMHQKLYEKFSGNYGDIGCFFSTSS